jgi:flagellar basal body rod protein FlgC
MAAQLVRMNAIASNLANAGTIAGSEQGAYRALKPVFSASFDGPAATVDVARMARTGTPEKKLDPNHPLADATGESDTAPVGDAVPHSLNASAPLAAASAALRASDLRRPLHFTAQLELVEALGAESLLHLRLGEWPLLARVPGTVAVAAGDRLDLAMDGSALCFFGHDGKLIEDNNTMPTHLSETNP